jgi:hypothetical protein
LPSSLTSLLGASSAGPSAAGSIRNWRCWPYAGPSPCGVHPSGSFTTRTVNGSGPVPGRSDSHSDGPFGSLAPQGDSARPDSHTDRPDVSFPGPVGRPRTPCGEDSPRRCL